MAIMGELTGQGRVVSGHLLNSTVDASKEGLAVYGMFKRYKITSETVTAWEELKVDKGAAKVISSVASSILPKGIGKTVGATLSASVSLGHTIKLLWATGEQSIIELPEKLFMVLKNMLGDVELLPEVEPTEETTAPEPKLTDQIFDLASRILPNKAKPDLSAENQAQEQSENVDVIAQLEKLVVLRNQGAISVEEYELLKANLMKNH